MTIGLVFVKLKIVVGFGLVVEDNSLSFSIILSFGIEAL